MAKIAVSDGRILWRYDYGRGQSQGQPALADGKLVFGAWNGHLHCLDAATGKLGWKWTNGSKSLFLSPGNIVPRIAGGRVFIDAPDRAVTCLDLASGSVVWRCTDYKAREASGMSADGKRFYVKTMDGELLAIDTAPDAFRRLWITPAGFGYDYTACPVTVSGGIAYLADRSGNVAAVREGLADGIVVTPSHNPPRDGGFGKIALVQADQRVNAGGLGGDHAAADQFVEKARHRGDDDHDLGDIRGDQLFAPLVGAIEQGMAFERLFDDRLFGVQHLHGDAVAAGKVGFLAARRGGQTLAIRGFKNIGPAIAGNDTGGGLGHGLASAGLASALSAAMRIAAGGCE